MAVRFEQVGEDGRLDRAAEEAARLEDQPESPDGVPAAAEMGALRPDGHGLGWRDGDSWTVEAAPRPR